MSLTSPRRRQKERASSRSIVAVDLIDYLICVLLVEDCLESVKQ